MGLFTRAAPAPAPSDPLDDAALLAESALYSFERVANELEYANSVLNEVEVSAHNEIEKQNARLAALNADRARNSKVITNIRKLTS